MKLEEAMIYDLCGFNFNPLFTVSWSQSSPPKQNLI